MHAADTDIVIVLRSFAAPPERVFDAWLDPATAGRWLFATATGEMIRVEIDPRVGGRFAIVERRDGQDVEHVGEYLSVDRPRQLAFTFAVPKFSAQSTRVTIDIVPQGTGCQLTLTHDGVLPEWSDRTRAGWGMLLDSLGSQLGESG
jgi:uncharacterized protein YndB with AHSA1/START domain